STAPSPSSNSSATPTALPSSVNSPKAMPRIQSSGMLRRRWTGWRSRRQPGLPLGGNALRNSFQNNDTERTIPFMNTELLTPSTEGAIWMRIVKAETGDLSSAAARILLRLDFSSADRRRMNALAEKASAGTLTARERKAAEAYNRVAHVLA